MPRITALTPTARDPASIAIRVDGKATTTIHRRHVDAMRLQVGADWTDALAAQARQAAALDRAVKQAMARLNRRAMTAAQLETKLKALGHDAAIVANVMAHLRRIGAIDDAAVGRAIVEEVARKPAGEKLLRAKLARRGLDAALVEELVASAGASRDPVAAARELVQSRERSMAKLDAMTRKRRLWGLLARRGFEEDVIEQVLGQASDDGA